MAFARFRQVAESSFTSSAAIAASLAKLGKKDFQRRLLRLMSGSIRLITQIRGRRKTPHMTSAIEETVKALVEFESALDSAKAEVSSAKAKTKKDTVDWAEAAKASAVSKAQEIASQRVAQAKANAEAEAQKIREKGETALKAFEGSISRHKAKAAELAASRLLGESA
jgi:hypothetical protein